MYADMNIWGLNCASKFVISRINFPVRKKKYQNCTEQDRMCTRTSVHKYVLCNIHDRLRGWHIRRGALFSEVQSINENLFSVFLQPSPWYHFQRCRSIRVYVQHLRIKNTIHHGRISVNQYCTYSCISVTLNLIYSSVKILSKCLTN
jgi:hypothetical protein